MKGPLDNIDENNHSDLTTNPKRKAIVYLTVMIFGEFIVKYIIFMIVAKMVLSNIAIYIVYSMMISLGTIFGIIIIVELLRFAWYKRKQKRSKIPLPDKDPLWFQVIESGFALWILSIVAVVGMAVYTYS